MKKNILLVSIVALSLLLPVKIYAKTFAYLIAKDEILKLDTESDLIVSRTKATYDIKGQVGEYKDGGCAVDFDNKYLVTVERHGFYVYELQTLKQIRFQRFPEIIKDPALVKLIYPLQGTKFYIQIDDMSLNKGQGGLINLSYTKKDQTYLGTAENLLTDIDEKFWFSEDQKTIYVRTEDRNIRIHDAQTFQFINIVDLSKVYATEIFGKEINDIKNGRALLLENKKTDKNNYSYLTYNLQDGSSTVRVLTDAKFMDEALLITNTDQVVFNDTTYKVKREKGTATSGILYFYDVKTGQKIGTTSLPSNFGGDILGVQPSGNKLYYFVWSTDENSIKLHAVDIATKTVKKEILVPKLYFMVFFEE